MRRILRRVFKAAAMGLPPGWHYSPVVGEDLVGPPAEQERACALVNLIQKCRGLVVEQRRAPSAALVPLRRSSSGPPSPCITPSTVTIVVLVSFHDLVPFSLFGGLGWCGHPV